VHSCTPHRIRASQDALAPLRETISEAGVHRLARAIRSTVGIEALVWLTDVAGLSREEAAGVMLWSARDASIRTCGRVPGNFGAR